MGPLAGIGDTIYQGVLIPILLAICIDITLTGTVWGAIVYLIPVSYTHLDVYKRQGTLLCTGGRLHCQRNHRCKTAD